MFLFINLNQSKSRRFNHVNFIKKKGKITVITKLGLITNPVKMLNDSQRNSKIQSNLVFRCIKDCKNVKIMSKKDNSKTDFFLLMR